MLRSHGREFHVTSDLSENQDKYKAFGLSDVKTKFLVNMKTNQIKGKNYNEPSRRK